MNWKKLKFLIRRQWKRMNKPIVPHRSKIITFYTRLKPIHPTAGIVYLNNEISCIVIFGLTPNIAHTLSHETTHQVLFDLEGPETCGKFDRIDGLDVWLVK